MCPDGLATPYNKIGSFKIPPGPCAGPNPRRKKTALKRNSCGFNLKAPQLANSRSPSPGTVSYSSQVSSLAKQGPKSLQNPNMDPLPSASCNHVSAMNVAAFYFNRFVANRKR
jgi:hypothetical protein